MHSYSSKVIIRGDAVKKNGKAVLSLQAFINGKRKIIPLGIEVEVNFFDKATEKVKIPGDRNRTKMLNGIIHKSKGKAEDIFFKAIAFDAPLSPERFAAKFQKGDTSKDFIDWLKNEIESAKTERAPSACRG